MLGMGAVARRGLRQHAPPRHVRLLPDITALAVLVWAGALTLVDQAVTTNISAYLNACAGVAIVLLLPPLRALVLFTLAWALLALGLGLVSTDPVTVLSNRVNDAINDENDLTDSAEASSEERETFAEETETSSEETEVPDEDSKLSDEATEASDEEIGTADTGEDMITDNPPSAETQVQVNLPDDFPELIEESDIELPEEEKTVPPVAPEDFTEGEGLYDYDKEKEKD